MLHCAYLTEPIFGAAPRCRVHLRLLHFLPSRAQKTQGLDRAKKNNALEVGQELYIAVVTLQ